MTRRNPDDDAVVDFILHLGWPRFAILLAAACLAGFCLAHRLVSFFYPGA